MATSKARPYAPAARGAPQPALTKIKSIYQPSADAPQLRANNAEAPQLRAENAKRRRQNKSDENNHVADVLVKHVLARLLTDVTEITAATHPSQPPCSAADDMVCLPRQSFSKSLGTLKRAYVCLLKTTIHDIYSPDVASQVRVLADTVKDKLYTHCPGEAKEGIQDLEGILEGLLEEFRWETVAEILELALDETCEQKELAYLKTKT